MFNANSALTQASSTSTELTHLADTLVDDTCNFSQTGFALRGVEFLANGTDVVVAASKCVAVVDIFTGATKQLINAPIGVMDVSSDGHYLLTRDSDVGGIVNGNATLFDLRTGEVLQQHLVQSLETIALSPNNTQFAVGTWQGLSGGTLELYDIATKERIWSIQTGLVDKIKFTPNGQSIANTTSNDYVSLWSTENGELIRTFRRERYSDISTIDISPDGTKLAMADDLLSIWEIATGQQINVVDIASLTSRSRIEFSPDDVHMLIDNTIWDLNTSATVHEFAVSQSVYSPGGTQVVGVGPGWLVSLFDASSGELLNSFNIKTEVTPPPPSVIPLAVGSSLAGALNSLTWQHYTVDSEANKTLKISLNPTENIRSLEMYARYDSLDTLYKDFTNTPTARGSYEILVTPTRPGHYFFSILGSTQSDTSGRFTIEAAYVDQYLSDLSPRRAGNQGQTAVTVHGAGFIPSLQVKLHKNGESIRSTGIEFINSQTVVAQFDLTNKAVGHYDMQVDWPNSQPQTITNAFELVEGKGAELTASINAPAMHRTQRIAALSVQYENIGDANLPAPLFIVSAEPAVPLRTMCDNGWHTEAIQLLGLNSDAPFDSLPPGASGTVSAQFQGTGENVVFHLDAMKPSTQPVPWETFKTSMRPAAIPEAEWDALWPQLIARLGTTWTDYLTVLHRNAKILQQRGEDGSCVSALLRMEVDALHGSATAALGGIMIDTATGLPIQGVDVGARDSSGNVARLATTDLLDGRFLFEGLPDGVYQLSVAGYVVETPATVTITNGADALDVQVQAHRHVALPLPPTPEAPDSEPALAVDSNGQAHLTWQHNGEIWYARYNAQGAWVDHQAVPNAMGTDPVIAYHDQIVSGNAPGLSVVWKADDGTGSYLQHSTAQMNNGAVSGWTALTDLTTSQHSDGYTALATMANGRPLLLWLQLDTNLEDDTDLYYKLLESIATGVINNSRQLSSHPLFPSSVEECQSIRNDIAYTLDPDIPIIGGVYKINIEGQQCVEETGLPLCKLNTSGNLIAGFDMGLVGIKGTATLSSNSRTMIKPCRYIMDQINVDIGIEGTLEIPARAHPALIAINMIPGLTIDMGALLGANVRGRLSWIDLTNPLGEYGITGNIRAGLTGGLYGEVEVLNALGGRVEGTVTVNLCYVNELGLCEDEPYCLQATAEIHTLFFKHLWRLTRGPCAMAAASTVSLPNITNKDQILTISRVSLQGSEPSNETFTTIIDPLVGTGNVYEGDTVLNDISNDKAHDGQPALARLGDGTVMAAWTKDSADINTAIGSSVVVATYNGTTWTTPVELQNATRFNSSTAIATAGNNEPLVIWASAPANVSLTSSVTDVLTAMAATDIYYAHRMGETWSTPAPVATLPGTDQAPQIAKAGNGNLVATWLNTTGDNIFTIQTATWNGATWSTATPIETETYVESLALAPWQNTLLLVWSQKRDSTTLTYDDLTLFYSTWQNGAWSTPAQFEKNTLTVSAAGIEELARANSTQYLDVPKYPPAECCEPCPPQQNNCHYLRPPQPDTFPVASAPSNNIRAIDPNEKAGPVGQGDAHTVEPGQALRYTIFFENLPTASAPAQEVFVTDQLDPHLDLSTLHFDEVTFTDIVIPIRNQLPGQFQARQLIQDYRDNVNETWWLDITGQLDPVTRVITWTLRTLDPTTGDLPIDALAGFLPPNDETGRGEGHVTFSIMPNADIPLGTQITNKANIVFDTNEPIITNEVRNTIDHIATTDPNTKIYLPVILR